MQPFLDLTVWFFLVLSRHYGVNGGDRKRIDSKNIILDFQVIKQMTDSVFVDTLKSKTEFFMKELLAHQKASGENHQYLSRHFCSIANEYPLYV